MWGKIVSSVTSALDFNQATLSGCIDIICVPQDDEDTLKSTPFHVRFGKAKLLRSREKVVTITVNGEEADLRMKLGAAGEAYFVEETEEEIREQLETSPIPSPTASPRSSPEVPELAPPLKLGESCETTIPGVAADPILDASSSNQNIIKEEIPKYGEWSWKWGDLPKKRNLEEVDYYASGDEIASQGTREREPDFTTEINSIVGDDETGLTFSLCGHLLNGQTSDSIRTQDVFNANLISWDIMDNDPMLWFNPSLIARFNGKPPFYPARVTLPLLASWIVFNKPLSPSAIEKLMNTTVTASFLKERSWRAWLAGSSVTAAPDFIPHRDSSPGRSLEVAAHLHEEIMPPLSPNSSVMDFSSCTFPLERIPKKRFRKSLRPTSTQLHSLKLNSGANSITFSVTSSLQGTKTVSSTIYLWPRNAKIVVSDVDGTITRSDVLGQLMPIVGRDWSHAGVAEFYTKIRQNGYYLLYLTARAIGQADSTRDYLFGLTQNEKEKLPDGPLILSPDRLFPSLKREVIDRKPYIFKIAALRDIRHLFTTQHSPFYAGFGNRESIVLHVFHRMEAFVTVQDHRAYVFIGIPESKVFIIDSRGVIHHVNTTYAKTYEILSEVSEHMFPPLRDALPFDEYIDDQFNSFNYWRAMLNYRDDTTDSDDDDVDKESLD